MVHVAGCCREIDLQHSVLSAQLSAQAAAIKQEREALLNQRINTDMLASLSEQVGRMGSTLRYTRQRLYSFTLATDAGMTGLPEAPTVSTC